MSEKTNILHVENVTMQFGGVVAVDNLSLDVNEGEIDSVALNSASAQATTFKVGDSFDANGLILDSQIIGSRPLYITTGYTTNLDGYTFTADDIGKKSVVVYFAGKETTYEIEVTE